MAFGSPASRQQDYQSFQDDSQISDNDEQDKMFVYGFPTYQSVAPIYYAPSIGYPYVMNPVMNTVCTLQPGVRMPTMPVLQQPAYPNPNVPVYGPQQPFPQQPRPPVPNPNYRPPNPNNRPPNQQPNQRPVQRPNQQPNQRPIQRPNQGPNQQPNQRPIQRPNQGPNQQPNQRPIQRPNQYPNQGPQQPQRFGNGQYNGGGQYDGGQPMGGQGGQFDHPKSDYNNQNQNLGPKSFDIDDKFIPTVANPFPAPIPGFFDMNGMQCNPYMQTVYAQQPAVYQQPYVYQQPIVVG